MNLNGSNKFNLFNIFNSEITPTGDTSKEPINTPLEDSLKIPKSIVDETEQHNWKILIHLISEGIKGHLSDIRLSNKSVFIIDGNMEKSINLINDFFTKQLLQNSPQNTNIEEEKNNINSPTITFEESENAKRLHLAIISQNNDFFKDLSVDDLEFHRDSMKNLLTTLYTDEKSNLPNKHYLNLFLEEVLSKSDSKYQIVYFSMPGIRPSNTAYGHIKTDNRMVDTSKLFIDTLISEKSNVKSKPFQFNDENNSFLIDCGGGDFLVISDDNEKTKLTKEQISNIINTVNSNCDLEDKNSTFPLVSSYLDNITISKVPSFPQIIENLKNLASSQKDALKSDTLLSITNLDALKKNLTNTFDFYKNHIGNNSDFENQKAFIVDIFSSLFIQMAQHNAKITGIFALPNVIPKKEVNTEEYPNNCNEK